MLLCPGELYADVPEHAEWLAEHVPAFDCPDHDIRQIYAYRWTVYRRHLRQTADGWVVTEFLPDVSWAGKHNTISCPAGHHLYEGRWLKEPDMMRDYLAFWFCGGDPDRYRTWLVDAAWALWLVHGDASHVVELVGKLEAYVDRGMMSFADPSGLLWQLDDREGMELSISGSGLRPTVNSYFYGDLVALGRIARLASETRLAERCEKRALALRAKIHEQLWDGSRGFFCTRACAAGNEAHKALAFYQSVGNPPPCAPGEIAGVRELIGYVPWCFAAADERHVDAWRQLVDPQAFRAPYGPTTAERRHPRFLGSFGHDCLWNGYSWPFATSQTLNGLARYLRTTSHPVIARSEYVDLLRTYARSQRLVQSDGTSVPFVDESLHPDTGEWVTRRRLHERNAPDRDRGAHYNHSQFANHVIAELVGVRPQPNGGIAIDPLVPEDLWDWFCLDDVRVRGRSLSIAYDRGGARYGKGAGLRAWVDGREAAARPDLGALVVPP